MTLEDLGVTEEELERLARTMKGYLKDETIEDFKKLCRMKLVVRDY